MTASLTCLWLAVGCALAAGNPDPKDAAPAAAAGGDEDAERLPPGQVPALEDSEAEIPNLSGAEPGIMLVWAHNGEKLYPLACSDSPATRKEIRRLLEDDKIPARPKLLYAGVLALYGDKAGQDFLLRRARETKDQEDARNIFWVLGHLPSLGDIDEQQKALQGLGWMEDFMVEVLKPDAAGGNQPSSWRSVALDSSCGDFATLLVRMKSPKAYDVLAALYASTKEQPYLKGLGELKDPRSEGTFLELIQKGVASQEARIAASALSAMKSRKALDLFLEHVADWDVICYLPRFSDERILPALKDALPKLKDSPLGQAQLMIVDLEGGDRLPRLLEVVRNPPWPPYTAYDALDRIAALKDERAVQPVAELLASSPDLSMRRHSYRVLGGIKSPASIKALIDALSIDFHALAKGKGVMEDNNSRCRDDIAGLLHELTGQNLGTDQAKWREWYGKTYQGK